MLFYVHIDENSLAVRHMFQLGFAHSSAQNRNNSYVFGMKKLWRIKKYVKKKIANV